jgi:hypothetical protein
MAYRDLRASLTGSEQVRASAEDKLVAQIQRVFLEVAQENGLADTDFFSGSPNPEEASEVVYDKFTPPHQR